MPDYIEDHVVSTRTAAQREARLAHRLRAEELLAKAEEWLDVDDETYARRGHSRAQTWIELAQLHLTIRDLL